VDPELVSAGAGSVPARRSPAADGRGTEARFWGGNLFGEANFPDKADAERLADIVARAGANIIRLHHVDVVAPWTDKVVQRSLFGGQQPESLLPGQLHAAVHQVVEVRMGNTPVGVGRLGRIDTHFLQHIHCIDALQSQGARDRQDKSRHQGVLQRRRSCHGYRFPLD